MTTPTTPDMPTRDPFGVAPDGASAELLTLVNARGTRLRVTTYGGAIVSLEVPDRDGRLADVVLGHDSLADYVRDGLYLGAIVGRYANRIAGARFILDGVAHEVSRNDGPNHLHGGARGFDKAVWRAAPFARPGERGVVLSHRSADGDQGFPGTLDVQVTYTLTDADEVVVDYAATTDRATIVNLTQHSYFNLAGAGVGDVLDHELTIHAARFLPVDASLIPTGELHPVEGTPFDFRRPARLRDRLGADDEQLRRGNGFDHTFVLDGARGKRSVAHAARLVEPASGRVLDVWTTEPGMQLYTGNFIGDDVPGKGGRHYRRHGALCLETQHFPDSPNRPEFPSTVVRPGEEYRSRTVFAFSARR